MTKLAEQLLKEHAWAIEALEKDTKKLETLKEQEKTLKGYEKKRIQKEIILLTGKVARGNGMVFAYNSLMSVLKEEENEAAE